MFGLQGYDSLMSAIGAFFSLLFQCHSSKDNLVGQPDPGLLSDRVPGFVVGCNPARCSLSGVVQGACPDAIAPQPQYLTLPLPNCQPIHTHQQLQNLPPSSQVVLQLTITVKTCLRLDSQSPQQFSLDCSTTSPTTTALWDSVLVAIRTECEDG